MADYTQIINAFKILENQKISGKTAAYSINPIDVGGTISALADLLLPIVNTINDFNILGGNTPPLNTDGEDGDIFIQGGTNLIFWKKDATSWIEKANVPIGISIVDGNINLQTSVSGMTITVSSGQWGINNVIYTKASQTQFTIDVSDISLDRIDAIFAKTDNTVHYVAGTASANPDSTKPTTPSNEVIVAYIYVPNSSSGNLPYIADGNVAPIPIPLTLTGGSDAPNNSNGIDGDIYIRKETSGVITFYQKEGGSWASVQNFNISGNSLPSGGTIGQSIENNGPGTGIWVNVPAKVQGDLDEKANIEGGNNFTGNQSIDGEIEITALATPDPFMVSADQNGKVFNFAEAKEGLIINTEAVTELTDNSGWTNNKKTLTSDLIFEGQFAQIDDYYYKCYSDNEAVRIYTGEVYVEDSLGVTPTLSYVNANYSNKPDGFRVLFTISNRLCIKGMTTWVFNDMTELT